jgi:hypothetical protein
MTGIAFEEMSRSLAVAVLPKRSSRNTGDRDEPPDPVSLCARPNTRSEVRSSSWRVQFKVWRRAEHDPGVERPRTRRHEGVVGSHRFLDKFTLDLGGALWFQLLSPLRGVGLDALPKLVLGKHALLRRLHRAVKLVFLLHEELLQSGDKALRNKPAVPGRAEGDTLEPHPNLLD